MKKTYENLMNVTYDAGNDSYTLEFQENGKSKFIEVKASDHEKAATDENYFDDKEIVEKIIEKNK